LFKLPQTLIWAIAVLTALALSLVFTLSVHAAQVENLYSASVTVDERGPATRGDAFAKALEQVLIKVVGSRQVLEQSGALQGLSAAESMTLTFSYRDNPEYAKALAEREARERDSVDADGEPVSKRPDNVGEGDEISGSLPVEESIEGKAIPEDPLPAPYLFDVQFATSAVNKLLNSYEVPLWGATRPSILLWVIAEQEGERRLLGAADEPELAGLVRGAKTRALPMFLPVADLVDINSVDLGELWGLYPESVSEASARYTPDAVVLIKIEQREELKSVQWLFDFRGLPIVGENTLSSGDPGNDALWQPFFDQVGSLLASRYAIRQTESVDTGIHYVSVTGLRSFEDYAGLQKYLSSSPNIDSLTLTSMQGAQVDYEIKLKGEWSQFVEYLALGGKLRSVASTQPLVFEPAEVELQDTMPEVGAEPSEGGWLFDEPFLPVIEKKFFVWVSGNNGVTP
jgi:hypothetical protein